MEDINNYKKISGVASINLDEILKKDFATAKKRDFERYLESPFRVEGIENKVRTKNAEVVKILNQQTGELEDHNKVSSTHIRLHDPAIYAKVFVEARDIVRRLSNNALRLFSYCSTHLRSSSDVIILNPNDVFLWCGFGQTVFYEAVKELLGYSVLAAKLGSTKEFFVNPNIMYNGDRVKLFNRNRQSVF